MSCSMTQCSGPVEAQTCNPSILSQALYDLATKLHAFVVVCRLFFKIDFLKNNSFRNTVSNRIQSRTDILSVLIWVQTVSKGYQQTTSRCYQRKRLKKGQILLVFH